ncbi:hypothetical protein NX88_11470 [Neisseria meningitidis]|nr:hypothetical protein NX88_11470 [Neisseria meningitidis]
MGKNAIQQNKKEGKETACKTVCTKRHWQKDFKGHWLFPARGGLRVSWHLVCVRSLLNQNEAAYKDDRRQPVFNL